MWRTNEDVAFHNAHRKGFQWIGGGALHHVASAHIKARPVPGTLQDAGINNITARQREVPMRAAVKHRVRVLAIAHEAQPTAIVECHGQRKCRVDVRQARGPTEWSVGHSVLTVAAAIGSPATRPGAIGALASAALSVCHGNDAHLTRTGKRDTPENTTN